MYSQDSEEKCKENHGIHTFRKKNIFTKFSNNTWLHNFFPVHMDNDMQVNSFKQLDSSTKYQIKNTKPRMNF